MSRSLKTVDAETLLATPLAPVRYIVNGLLPAGLHLFCGSPKIGKSWMMLWLCLMVAKGEPLWEFPTNQCGVLYLCLEDTFTRIQNRLFQITDEAPDNLHFAIMADQINLGLQDQIGGFIKEHPDTRLIVIDTLQRIRGLVPDSNAYANDYRDISSLKALADKHEIAVVLVHHLRKLTDGDPLLKVSGTTGLTGAVDSVFVLEKDKRSSDTAMLYISSRDIGYREYTLRFANCVWELVSCEVTETLVQHEVPPFFSRLVDFMTAQSEWSGSASELLVELDDKQTPPNTVTKLLNQFHSTLLAEKGIIYSYNRTGKGRVIHLTSDSCDGCDSYLPTEKKPSQPSPAVTGAINEKTK